MLKLSVSEAKVQANIICSRKVRGMSASCKTIEPQFEGKRFGYSQQILMEAVMMNENLSFPELAS